MTTPASSSAAASLDLLDRSRHSLLEACQTQEVSQRYLQAQLGALRAAELDGYGMIGCGAIYQAYARGQLLADHRGDGLAQLV